MLGNDETCDIMLDDLVDSLNSLESLREGVRRDRTAYGTDAFVRRSRRVAPAVQHLNDVFGKYKDEYPNNVAVGELYYDVIRNLETEMNKEYNRYNFSGIIKRMDMYEGYVKATLVELLCNCIRNEFR